MKWMILTLTCSFVFGTLAQAQDKACGRMVAAQFKETRNQLVAVTKLQSENPDRIINTELTFADAKQIMKVIKSGIEFDFYTVVISDSYYDGASDTYLAAVRKSDCEVLAEGRRLPLATDYQY